MSENIFQADILKWRRNSGLIFASELCDHIQYILLKNIGANVGVDHSRSIIEKLGCQNLEKAENFGPHEKCQCKGLKVMCNKLQEIYSWENNWEVGIVQIDIVLVSE